MMLLLIAALLLPLFPLSLPVNALLQVVRPPVLRAILLVALPCAGVAILTDAAVPAAPMALGLQVLAVFTALLYAWRLLVVHDVFIWARLQATSAWPLVWLAWLHGMSGPALWFVALVLSLPAAMLMLLSCGLARRLGAAYLGLHGRIGPAYPRLAGALTVVLLAALAAPPFPGFFVILDLLRTLGVVAAVGVLLVWLLWSWAAAVMWQNALFGPPWTAKPGTRDLSRPLAVALIGLAGLWALTGLAWSSALWMH
jgi:hypothetical protein